MIKRRNKNRSLVRESRHYGKRCYLRESYDLTEERREQLNNEMAEHNRILMEDFGGDDYIAALSQLPSFKSESVIRTKYDAHESVDEYDEQLYFDAMHDAELGYDPLSGEDSATGSATVAVEIPMRELLSSDDPATRYIIGCADLEDYSERREFLFSVTVEQEYESDESDNDSDIDYGINPEYEDTEITLENGKLTDLDIEDPGVIRFWF